MTLRSVLPVCLNIKKGLLHLLYPHIKCDKQQQTSFEGMIIEINNLEAKGKILQKEKENINQNKIM